MWILPRNLFGSCPPSPRLVNRIDQLRCTGNGVHRTQAAHAFRGLLERALT